MRLGSCLRRVSVVALGLLWAGIGLAAPVDGASARTAAQAWIDGGYSLRKLTARSVVDVQKVAVGTERAHVARLENGGVVVLPTDDRIDPVIAFSPSATEVPTDPNSPFAVLLARDLAARMAVATNAAAPTLTKSTLLSAASSTVTQTPAQRRWVKLLGKANGPSLLTATSRPSVSDVRVAPLVKSRWGQTKNSMYSNWGDICFNYHTPQNSYCGCVATALAQLMRFHRYPTSVTAVSRTCAYNGTQSTYTMKGGTYDYDKMPLVPEACPGVSWYDRGATSEQREMIGRLTYDCGVAMQMNWGPTGSSAGGAAANGPLKDVFGYKNARTTTYTAGLATAAYREQVIHANLDAGYPVLLGVGGPSGGHEIVADGYGCSDGVTYTHLNMGWANAADVWYALPDIVTSDCTFNVVDSAVYNVFPSETGEIVSGRIVNGLGNPVAGATVSIRYADGSSDLKTATTGDTGVFGFVVPASKSYVVTARFGVGTVSVPASTGTSKDSYVILNVGSYSYSDSKVACGNVSCGDIVLSSVPRVAAPVLSPNGGSFYPTATVAISCATEGAMIQYTLDGSDPTETSPVYVEPLTVDDDVTVKARARKDGCLPSLVTTATFTYNTATLGPKGDCYANPIAISGTSGSRVIADDSKYSVENNEAKHTLVGSSYLSQYRTCWYDWTAPGNGTMTFTSYLDNPWYYVDSAVAVYPVGTSVPTDTSSRIAMARSSGGGEASASFSVTRGTTYRIVGVALAEYTGTFTLSWSGSLTDPKTIGSEVPVPYSWMSKYYPSAGNTAYETLAKTQGVNENRVWESYLAGLDPTNANSKLLATIRMEGMTPVVEWNVTNAAATSLGYKYKLLGNTQPRKDGWTDKTDSAHRFFKVVIVK